MIEPDLFEIELKRRVDEEMRRRGIPRWNRRGRAVLEDALRRSPAMHRREEQLRPVETRTPERLIESGRVPTLDAVARRIATESGRTVDEVLAAKRNALKGGERRDTRATQRAAAAVRQAILDHLTRRAVVERSPAAAARARGGSRTWRPPRAGDSGTAGRVARVSGGRR